MEKNENPAIEQENPAVAEPAVEAAQQVPTETQDEKLYTQKDVDGIVGAKKSRWEARSKRENEKAMAKHNELVEVLKAGTGKEDIDDIITHLRGFYNQPAAAPAPSSYSDRDIGILAQAEAADLINAGSDEVEEELERLSALGKDGMTAREKEVFRLLATHKQSEARTQELAALGIPKEVYQSEAFLQFAGKFAAATPVREVYDLYQKTHNTENYTPPGSVKNVGADDGVKDFYTPEEAAKFTVKDFNDNPKLWQRVNESRLRWK